MPFLRRARAAFVVALGCLATAVLVRAAAWWVPYPAGMLSWRDTSVELLDRRGRPLRLVLSPGGTDCRPVATSVASPRLAQALIACEDKRFLSHPGIDLLALLHALKQNAASRRVVRGASTITTQVARMTEPRPRTLSTKCVEAFRALQLESRLTKEQILDQYLNRAPFGGNLAGAGAASRAYFGKEPSSLSLSEAALLAGLPQSPSRLRPDRHPDRAASRRDWVLDRMEACGFITRTESAIAKAQAVPALRRPSAFLAPHFTDLVLARRRFAAGPGVTSLDLDLQVPLESIVSRHAARLATQGIHGLAAVILDVRRSSVAALVGSPDYFDEEHAGQVNAATARRAPGSTLKPFIYASAFDRGILTPETVLADTPRSYADYDPGNFDGAFQGTVTVREALVRSLNMPALRAAETVGLEACHATLRSLGLDTIDRPAAHYGLGLALGNAEVRLLDLANAYACLARGGEWLPLRLLENEPRAPARRVFSPQACYLAADILGGEERIAEAVGHRADVPMPRAAWKTGTSSGRRDAWTVAWNPDYVVAVWAGHPDGRPCEELVGGRVAAPLAFDILRCLYPSGNSPWFAPPPGLSTRRVCSESGRVPGPLCLEFMDDLAIDGITRIRLCDAHRGDRIGPSRQSDGAARNAQRLRLLSPANGSSYRLDASRPASGQQLPLRAGGPAEGPLYWFVDGGLWASAAAAEPVRWPLTPGRHRIACADSSGHSAAATISVE
jgi:penicillin-binding protein 1C